MSGHDWTHDDWQEAHRAIMARAVIEAMREPNVARWAAEQPIWSLGRHMWDWWRSMNDAALK